MPERWELLDDGLLHAWPKGHVIYRCHVTLFAKRSMTERNCKAIRRAGRYCVARAPNNQSCPNTNYTPGVNMHQFLADPLVRTKWIKFVTSLSLSTSTRPSAWLILSRIATEVVTVNLMAWQTLRKTKCWSRDQFLPDTPF